MSRLFLRRAVLAALSPLMMASAVAQAPGDAWPTRPVRIVVPYAAGASTDIVTRRVAQALGERLGQSVVVENRTGASGTIGVGMVVREKPDGYTLSANDVIGHLTVPLAMQNMPYDPAADLVPIAAYVLSPYGIVVNAASPYRTLQDLGAAAKAAPGKLTYGSGGAGTTTHMAAADFALASGVSLMHVPFKGAAEGVMAVLSGTIDMQVVSPASVASNVKAGKLRLLAISGTERLKLLPDVPTFAEAGFKDYEIANYIGLWAPRGTPPAIVERLRKEVAAVMGTPQMRSFAEGLGSLPQAVVGPDFIRMLEQNGRRWKTVAERIQLTRQ